MDGRAIETALSIERKIYTALLDFLEITSELSDAFQRQDQVSFQLNLNMRQESVNQLAEYQALLKKECEALPPDVSEQLKEVLLGKEVSGDRSTQKLFEQAHKNRSLLERAKQADQAVNQRLGGQKSFYSDVKT